jgi:ribonucleoside-diphosphate reductase alpha chain
MSGGFALKRHFSVENASPYDRIAWREVAVAGIEGGIEAPSGWSQTAVEIAAHKYLRRRYGENSVRALIRRVTASVRRAGEWQGYFSGAGEATAFEDELSHILLHQLGSFNSPVYFNVGVFPEFGVLGTAEN